MQFRLEITGHVRIRKFVPHALEQADRFDGNCPPETPQCEQVPTCADQIFTYNSHGS
jgi:hypothetical protein